MSWQLPIGAAPENDGVRFRVWAPDRTKVEVVIIDGEEQELSRHPLTGEDGYFSGHVAGITPGAFYKYALDGDTLRADPASRYQPQGVHGPSQVIDPGFDWRDGAWQGVALQDAVLYEVHIGTFTDAGTFEAAIERLPYLKDLGVTAIEIMPVADFPGDRNWGYDGVYLFAPARTYGGPQGMKQLIDAAHAHGLAVIQDIVYNHLGPDGNYLRDFSTHYFDPGKHTSWGDAVNFAARPVREFFIANALYWTHEYHVDGFRMDATHAILDDNPRHILAELTATVRASLPAGRNFIFSAEDERNDVIMIKPVAQGGMGFDALWADDFHHQMRSALAGDNEGYFAEYSGNENDLAETLRRGWFFVGQTWGMSGAPRGTDPSRFDPPHLLYCIQNHDQIGNRPFGDRLNHNIAPDAYRAASALLLLSPYTPLLFQGQEWAAGTSFLFFTDHNAELGAAVTKGRREEFAYFAAFQGQEIPDPQSPDTFRKSKVDWNELTEASHEQILALNKAALRLRHTLPALRDRHRAAWDSAPVDEDAIALRYRAESGDDDLLLLVNLKGALDVDLAALEITAPPQGRAWCTVLSSEDVRFGGSGEGASFTGAGKFVASRPLAVALIVEH